MSRRARRALRPLVRRVLPGAPGGLTAPTGRELPVAGADGPIAVTEEGRGPAILLLPPGSADRSSWAGVAAALAGRFRVLRFDRWSYRDGHAAASPSGAEAMAAEVADVLAVAAAVGERPLLVGHSSGAVVALESALAAPSAFRGLVLYEPPVAVAEPLGGEVLRRARAALDAGDPDRAVAIHMREIVGAGRLMVAAMRRVPPVWQIIRGHAAAQITDDEAIESLGVGLGRYAGLELPVLLLGGGRSPAHLRERLAALAAALPRLEEVVVLEGQGHMANLRAPGEVARVVAAFADRLAS
ncbi:MAG TPA: alpha/beta hydrolase [Actinomycetota bacterium]|jgi:pimeloyl-ACP methyl ester carboxylesterase|nr:alpha/beta hydrolase [Actinomycetota bacterium]